MSYEEENNIISDDNGGGDVNNFNLFVITVNKNMTDLGFSQADQPLSYLAFHCWVINLCYKGDISIQDL
jgi:hypothetical protein